MPDERAGRDDRLPHARPNRRYRDATTRTSERAVRHADDRAASAARGRAGLALPRCRRRQRLGGARVGRARRARGRSARDRPRRSLPRRRRTPSRVPRARHHRDELPAERFDLAHARGVLEHVRDREAGIAKMVAAVRPGGWWWSKIPTGWCSTRRRCRKRSASCIARCATRTSRRRATTRISAPAPGAAHRRGAGERGGGRQGVHDVRRDAVDGVVRARARALAAAPSSRWALSAPTSRPRHWPKPATRSAGCSRRCK